MERRTNGGDGVLATLDAYLDHLRRYAGPADQPCYREIRPGVFDLVTSMSRAAAPKIYTCEEMMGEFGFTR